MRNITVAIDDETYRRARVVAAQRDTSVSGLVKAYLSSLLSPEDEFDRLKRMEDEVRAQVKGFSVSENVPRDELYRRKP